MSDTYPERRRARDRLPLSMADRTPSYGDEHDDRREPRPVRRRVRAAPPPAPPLPDACGDEVPCAVRSAIQILQEKWVLHIIHTLLDGPRGFNDLGRAVGGCNPTTLAQRLARLESAGIVIKGNDDAAEGSGRSVYSLTPSGKALDAVVGALGEWARAHFGDDPSTLA